MLPENALEGKPQAERGATRRRIEGIALPLVAPIAERLEDIGGGEILRLGRGGGALQDWRVDDVPHLDDPRAGADLHQRHRAGCFACRLVDYGIGERVGDRGTLVQPAVEFGLAREGAIAHVGPERVMVAKRPPQRGAMGGGVELFEPCEAPRERRRARSEGGPGVEFGAERLVGHGRPSLCAG